AMTASHEEEEENHQNSPNADMSARWQGGRGRPHRPSQGTWPHRSPSEEHRTVLHRNHQAANHKAVLAASTTPVLPVPGDAGWERPGRLAGHRLNMAPRRWQARR